MRRISLPLAFLFAFAASPVFAADPASQQPAVAKVDRLLDVMDMKSMMAGMMEQMTASQHTMLMESFGKDASESQREQLQNVLAKSDAIVRKHMDWSALEPVVRNVYARVFTQDEVDAMIAFYSSAQGAAILKKTPQAAALTMQELQPIMIAAMQEVKAAVESETAKP